MNERAFTPGPWFVSEPNDPERTGLLIKPIPGDVVAEIDILSNAIANARLIAAAPELYAAAAHAEAWISDMPHGDNCYLSAHYDGDPCDQCNCGKESVLAALEAALAKAVP